MLQRVRTLLLVCAPLLAAGDDFTVKFEVALTSEKRDSFLITVREAKAPIAARRFRDLVNSGFFSGCKFYRVMPGFIVQFGLSGDPALNKKYKAANLKDDPVKVSNKKGTLVFATAGPNTRTSQMFINFGDNGFLDRQGFSPYSALSFNATSKPEVTSPIGENPWRSKKPLSPKLMNICEVRVFGPAVANTNVPFLLLTFTGSSFKLAALYFLFNAGSPLNPNWTINPGTTRKNLASS